MSLLDNLSFYDKHDAALVEGFWVCLPSGFACPLGALALWVRLLSGCACSVCALALWVCLLSGSACLLGTYSTRLP